MNRPFLIILAIILICVPTLLNVKIGITIDADINTTPFLDCLWNGDRFHCLFTNPENPSQTGDIQGPSL